MGATAQAEDTTPMRPATPTSSEVSRTAARQAVMTAMTAPCSSRNSRKVWMSVATLHPTEASVKIASAASTTGLRPNRSDRAPANSWTMAQTTA